MALRGRWARLHLFLVASCSAATFNQDVQPILTKTCAICHNEKLASGGFDVSVFLRPESFSSHREGWEAILGKIRAGEMPPKGIPRPAKLDAFVTAVETELDRIDRATKPDPGRVTAHRLNRNEYANTVRDLLGVDFRASDEFPADDSGYGFDNIGDVLTVSPALMQKYLSVAEHIASRAGRRRPAAERRFLQP